QHVFPRISFSSLLKKGNVTVSGSGQGIIPSREAAFFNLLNIESGKTLTDQTKGILLGHGLAKALGLKPGDRVTLLVNATDGTLSQAELTVAGIFQTGSLDFDSRIFRIPLTEAQSLMKTKHVESLSLGLARHDEWDQLAEAVVQEFPHLEGASFAELDKVYYQHSVDWLHGQFQVIQIIILSIVLLGIFNTISSAILERKQEIGNFRANGESILDIMRLILMEGSLVGMLGSLSGIALTYAVIMLLLNNQIEMPPGPGLTRACFISFKFDWRMVWTSGGLSLLAALLASGLAGLRVARMSIASALRH
ncbi:MAG: FtsX-like permease family protein, partial [Parachlamydia sp.]|nr:FtsX-like permease family protein [Parachlamydia sp.]